MAAQSADSSAEQKVDLWVVLRVGYLVGPKAGWKADLRDDCWAVRMVEYSAVPLVDSSVGWTADCSVDRWAAQTADPKVVTTVD